MKKLKHIIARWWHAFTTDGQCSWCKEYTRRATFPINGVNHGICRKCCQGYERGFEPSTPRMADFEPARIR